MSPRVISIIANAKHGMHDDGFPIAVACLLCMIAVAVLVVRSSKDWWK